MFCKQVFCFILNIVCHSVYWRLVLIEFWFVWKKKKFFSFEFCILENEVLILVLIFSRWKNLICDIKTSFWILIWCLFHVECRKFRNSYCVIFWSFCLQRCCLNKFRSFLIYEIMWIFFIRWTESRMNGFKNCENEF